MSRPRISVCVPTHDMANGEYFLNRLKSSLDQQTFRDFELVITKEGSMPVNSNAAIKKAKGEIIKLLYMDDFLSNEDALQHINDYFKGGWMATGCVHTSDGERYFSAHYPTTKGDFLLGQNTIGSPSVMAFENNDPLLFDENMSWLLDCDLYYRLYERYGKPTLLNELDVVIGVGDHQMTNIMSDQMKLAEHRYLAQKYA